MAAAFCVAGHEGGVNLRVFSAAVYVQHITLAEGFYWSLHHTSPVRCPKSVPSVCCRNSSAERLSGLLRTVSIYSSLVRVTIGLPCFWLLVVMRITPPEALVP